MTANDDRLKRLEARAKGLGLRFFHHLGQLNFSIVGEGTFPWTFNGWLFKEGKVNEYCLAAAESLLTSLSMERGPVVEIAEDCKLCQLWSHHEWQPHPGDCALDAGRPDDPATRIDYQNMLSGPSCPKLAPSGKQWRLCFVDEEDV